MDCISWKKDIRKNHGHCNWTVLASTYQPGRRTTISFKEDRPSVSQTDCAVAVSFQSTRLHILSEEQVDGLSREKDSPSVVQTDCAVAVSFQSTRLHIRIWEQVDGLSWKKDIRKNPGNCNGLDLSPKYHPDRQTAHSVRQTDGYLRQTSWNFCLKNFQSR